MAAARTEFVAVAPAVDCNNADAVARTVLQEVAGEVEVPLPWHRMVARHSCPFAAHAKEGRRTTKGVPINTSVRGVSYRWRPSSQVGKIQIASMHVVAILLSRAASTARVPVEGRWPAASSSATRTKRPNGGYSSKGSYAGG